jgi:undecaprenyl phosphate-alpha-L-ara4FN deformylase
MTRNKVCIRIDIDTVRDTQVLPVVLEILDSFDASATFFVTTGEDMTFKNYKNYINPLKLLQKKAIQQHGIHQMLRGILYKQQVQKSSNVQLILENNHELGLHGYHHYNWMNTLQQKSQEEITEWINKGSELFEDAYGFRPLSFASPGFATSPQFLEALEHFNFEYSSDFRGKEAFYPCINKRKLSTLQLPVAEKSFGELEFEGISNDAIYNIMKNGLESAQNFFVFYMHPSYEPILKRNLLVRVLEYITTSDKFEITTMHQLAKHIKRKDLDENPANI